MMLETLKQYLGAILTLTSLLVTGVFWVHTMDGIPKRVDKLENDVELIKTQLIENNTKTDIILKDTTQIRMFILQEHAR